MADSAQIWYSEKRWKSLIISPDYLPEPNVLVEVVIVQC